MGCFGLVDLKVEVLGALAAPSAWPSAPEEAWPSAAVPEADGFTMISCFFPGKIHGGGVGRYNDVMMIHLTGIGHTLKNEKGPPEKKSARKKIVFVPLSAA